MLLYISFPFSPSNSPFFSAFKSRRYSSLYILNRHRKQETMYYSRPTINKVRGTAGENNSWLAGLTGMLIISICERQRWCFLQPCEQDSGTEQPTVAFYVTSPPSLQEMSRVKRSVFLPIPSCSSLFTVGDWAKGHSPPSHRFLLFSPGPLATPIFCFCLWFNPLGCLCFMAPGNLSFFSFLRWR